MDERTVALVAKAILTLPEEEAKKTARRLIIGFENLVKEKRVKVEDAVNFRKTLNVSIRKEKSKMNRTVRLEGHKVILPEDFSQSFRKECEKWEVVTDGSSGYLLKPGKTSGGYMNCERHLIGGDGFLYCGLENHIVALISPNGERINVERDRPTVSQIKSWLEENKAELGFPVVCYEGNFWIFKMSFGNGRPRVEGRAFIAILSDRGKYEANLYVRDLEDVTDITVAKVKQVAQRINSGKFGVVIDGEANRNDCDYNIQQREYVVSPFIDGTRGWEMEAPYYAEFSLVEDAETIRSYYYFSDEEE